MRRLCDDSGTVHGDVKKPIKPGVVLFSAELKRAKAEDKKCHAKSMMSKKADKTIR